MFDSAAIQAMAKQAKQELAQQQEEQATDIYAGMMDEVSVDEPQTSNSDEDTAGYWSGSIATNPTENQQYPKISSQPSEEDLDNHPSIDPFDKPIFPGGPLQSQINSWKKQWDGYTIYATEILEDTFVFRTLNRFEYKQIVALQNSDPLMREEVICETVTLWPAKYDWTSMATRKAGTPSTYSQIIMEKSGFTKEYGIQVL